MSMLDVRDLVRGRPPGHDGLELDGERTMVMDAIVDSPRRVEDADTSVEADGQVFVTRGVALGGVAPGIPVSDDRCE